MCKLRVLIGVPPIDGPPALRRSSHAAIVRLGWKSAPIDCPTRHLTWRTAGDVIGDRRVDPRRFPLDRPTATAQQEDQQDDQQHQQDGSESDIHDASFASRPHRCDRLTAKRKRCAKGRRGQSPGRTTRKITRQRTFEDVARAVTHVMDAVAAILTWCVEGGHTGAIGDLQRTVNSRLEAVHELLSTRRGNRPSRIGAAPG